LHVLLLVASLNRRFSPPDWNEAFRDHQINHSGCRFDVRTSTYLKGDVAKCAVCCELNQLSQAREGGFVAEERSEQIPGIAPSADRPRQGVRVADGKAPVRDRLSQTEPLDSPGFRICGSASPLGRRWCAEWRQPRPSLRAEGSERAPGGRSASERTPGGVP
jgi:hypothetical protein